ncbi:hypothetical protein [Halomarina litorea]|uniref:hypothetical protein n=1 Tax=Halomarina litorea TaxID=2961595 RepID=UPI0020C54246|nr:hypothetical protein [Halomarina sp. BCD28]
MSALIDLMRVLLAANLVLLVALGYVWGRNYLRFRSKHTLGLALFALFLFGENAVGFYLFVLEPTLSAWVSDPQAVPRPAQLTLFGLRAMEFGGLLFLTWTTWD